MTGTTGSSTQATGRPVYLDKLLSFLEAGASSGRSYCATIIFGPYEEQLFTSVSTIGRGTPWEAIEDAASKLLPKLQCLDREREGAIERCRTSLARDESRIPCPCEGCEERLRPHQLGDHFIVMHPMKLVAKFTPQHPEDQSSQIFRRRKWLLQSHEMGGDEHGFPMPDRFPMRDDDLMSLNSDRCLVFGAQPGMASRHPWAHYRLVTG